MIARVVVKTTFGTNNAADDGDDSVFFSIFFLRYLFAEFPGQIWQTRCANEMVLLVTKALMYVFHSICGLVLNLENRTYLENGVVYQCRHHSHKHGERGSRLINNL